MMYKRFRNISVVTKCHQRGSKIQASVIIQHDFDTLLQVVVLKKDGTYSKGLVVYYKT